MNDSIITSAETQLVRVTRFISPEYSRKYLRTQQASDCDRLDTHVYEPAPAEDRILEWLNANTLCRLREPFPEHTHNDFGYLLQSQDRALYVICPRVHQLTTPAITTPTCPLVYQWRLTVRSQPQSSPIPKLLTSALEAMNFKEVSDFK